METVRMLVAETNADLNSRVEWSNDKVMLLKLSVADAWSSSCKVKQLYGRKWKKNGGFNSKNKGSSWTQGLHLPCEGVATRFGSWFCWQ